MWAGLGIKEQNGEQRKMMITYTSSYTSEQSLHITMTKGIKYPPV